ncbi:hypothetical protein [Microcoleus sp. CAWBG50]|nr:hypothetical protein [Microcoleus sp. CAWBG50]
MGIGHRASGIGHRASGIGHREYLTTLENRYIAFRAKDEVQI